MICLDSSLMVDFLRNKGNAIARIRSLENENIVTTIINVYELESGIWAMKNANYQVRIENLSKLLSRIGLLQLESESVNKSARIFGELGREGKVIEDMDILIGGICLVNGCNKIITKNVKHFSRIKGLKVETY